MQLYNSDISGTKNMYFGSVQLKQGFGELKWTFLHFF